MDSTTLWLDTLFASYIDNSDIDIVFEEKEKLELKKPVLNFSIHPLRFGDDVFFNFESNNEKLREKLKKYEVNYNIFYAYADILRASYLKTIKKDKYHKNSLLLVGQTQKDKVIFDGKKYLSLLDYIDKIKDIAQDYDYIYFKPHPYAKNSKYIAKELKKELGTVEVVYDNVYHLLSSDNISCVVGLNSSVLYEAIYFHKKTEFLYQPYFDIGGNDIGIYGDYWDSSFWSDILGIEDKDIRLPFAPNRLRIALNDFWGYHEVSEEIILKDILKSKVKNLLSRYVR